MLGLRDLTRVSILAAAGFLLMLIQLPLYPQAPYLKYDAGDIPVLIGAFALGPWKGVWVALIKDLLYMLFHFSPHELVGVPMNFLAGASFAACAGSVYALRKTKRQAVMSLGLGALASTAVMMAANLTVLPLFLAVFFPDNTVGTAASLRTVLLTTALPFNLIKAGLNAILVFLVYKRISPILKAAQWELPAASPRAQESVRI